MSARATALHPAEGSTTSWAIEAEWGFPDSFVIWLWAGPWCVPVRVQAGTVPPLLLPPRPALFRPNPLPVIEAA